MLDLTTLFEVLAPAAGSSGEGESFSARQIPGYERHRIGKDSNGLPVLLISTSNVAGRGFLAPISLEHLTVQYDAKCRIFQTRGVTGTAEERFTVVKCVSVDPILQSYFLRVAGSLVTVIGPAPSRLDVKRAVESLIELFRAMTDPARKSVQGLWAEVFLIANAFDPITLTVSWHAEPEDRYDFNESSRRIEVKSASGRIRRHHFSLEQLLPPAGTDVIIASVLIESAGSGSSIADLLETVRSRMSNRPDLALLIDRIVGQTLGDAWRATVESRFDLELAKASLAFFNAKDIPCPAQPMPLGVTEVRFRSDLSGLSSLGKSRLRQAGGIFRAALPK